MLPVNWADLPKEQVAHLRKYSPALYRGYVEQMKALADKREQEKKEKQ